MPELGHIEILLFLILLCGIIFPEHFFQLSDFQLIEFELLFLLPENEHFLLFLNSPFIQFNINGLDLVLPLFLALLFSNLQVLNFILQCLDHVLTDSLDVLLCLFGLFGFFLIQGQLGLYFLKLL